MDYQPDPTVAQVEVTVTTKSDGTLNICCNPNPVPVKVLNSLITFNLRTPGFHFKSTGAVVIKGTFEDFPYPSWTQNATTAGLFDICNNIDTFDYTLYIRRDTDDVEFSVDPVIDNGGIVGG
jgi:hypothetical protein